MMQLYLHPQHLESLWSALILSKEYRKYCKEHLHQEVVILGEIREAAVKHRCSRSCICHGARFIIWLESEACWTHKLLWLHIASPANHHIEIGFGQRHCDGSCVVRLIDRQSVICYVISRWKAICVPIWLPVSFVLISPTKLWDMMIHLCMCKGRTHHAKVLEAKSDCIMAKKLDFCLPITDKWENRSYISDQIY